MILLYDFAFSQESLLSSIQSFVLNFVLFIIQGYIAVRAMKAAFILFRCLYEHFLCRPLDLEQYRNKWTVITGCTDGIGLAYTEELARSKGLKKFFLIGRNPTKLEHVASRLIDQFQCKVQTAIFDFGSTDYAELAQKLENLGEIGILINCAGMGVEKIAVFKEQPAGIASKILQVNLMSAIRMMELILPGMIKRNQGIVVNFSSICGWRPTPYVSSYPASKAGLSFFSSALQEELRATSGVRVQCVMPLLVATKMTSYEADEANNFMIIDPQVYVREAVRRIGMCPMTTGCLQHDLQIVGGQFVGFWLFKQFFVPLAMLRMHRQRAERFFEQRNSNGQQHPQIDHVQRESRDDDNAKLHDEKATESALLLRPANGFAPNGGTVSTEKTMNETAVAS